MVVLFLIFKGNSTLFFVVAALIYIPMLVVPHHLQGHSSLRRQHLHCFRLGLNAGDPGPKKPAHFHLPMPWQS